MSSASITSVLAPTGKSPLAACKTTRNGRNSSRRCCTAASHPKRSVKSPGATICEYFTLLSLDRNARRPFESGAG
jgi:hypothetical protein